MSVFRFPPGEPVIAERAFHESLFSEIDEMLRHGNCPAGWLNLERAETCLTCLIHKSRPFLAGLSEPEAFSWVPLREFPVRARQLEGAVCRLFRADHVRVLLVAVHFRNRPVLQAATNFVDLGYVLDELAREGHDAALSMERSGLRTLMFLQKGIPALIFFGDPAQDPGEGSVADRFLMSGFAPDTPVGKVEVFDRLKIEPDPDSGRPLAELAREAEPPPPMNVQVQLAGRPVLTRSFMPPSMVIGRNHACELGLDNLSVSWQHARLSWERGRFAIKDLGSANGTFVNGERVDRKVLDPSDIISVGKFKIGLAAPVEPLAVEATMLMDFQPGEMTLYLVGDELSVPLTNTITIGKAQGVDVRARGMLVKPLHARIETGGPDECRLTCLGSAGVELNGKKVTSAAVRKGDELVVGKSRFRLVAIPTIR